MFILNKNVLKNFQIILLIFTKVNKQFLTFIVGRDDSQIPKVTVCCIRISIQARYDLEQRKVPLYYFIIMFMDK